MTFKYYFLYQEDDRRAEKMEVQNSRGSVYYDNAVLIDDVVYGWSRIRRTFCSVKMISEYHIVRR